MKQFSRLQGNTPRAPRFLHISFADTINDLIWAAHDGNLDTKQYISTVKLIAEDIIRTGSQVNICTVNMKNSAK